MAYFPLFIQLEGRTCLVAGGGPVGLRKAKVLADSGARVRVVAPSLCDGFEMLPGAELIRRGFLPEDLDEVALAVAATDDRRVNGEIARLCAGRNIPVDVADDREACTFLFPAVSRRGKITVGISTGGTSPLLAGRLRRMINRLLPCDLDSLSRRMAQLREKEKQEDGRPDRCALSRVLEEEMPEQPMVYLVGAGCGDAGLVTWRALELLSICDVLIYDHLANPELLELCREECRKLYVGKAAGAHSASQGEINRLLVEQAQPGRVVVRLKGGDPFVFGRGGEEAEVLAAHGIPFQVVPGVTSATAVPASAGIPVTHRNLARSFHVITGHTAQEGCAPDYDLLARLEGTLVFLMGLGAAPEICSGLVAAGKSPDTPAAAISNGTLPDQRTVRAPLADLPRAISEGGLTSPAILVIGEVAALHFEDQTQRRT